MPRNVGHTEPQLNTGPSEQSFHLITFRENKVIMKYVGFCQMLFKKPHKIEYEVTSDSCVKKIHPPFPNSPCSTPCPAPHLHVRPSNSSKVSFSFPKAVHLKFLIFVMCTLVSSLIFLFSRFPVDNQHECRGFPFGNKKGGEFCMVVESTSHEKAAVARSGADGLTHPSLAEPPPWHGIPLEQRQPPSHRDLRIVSSA